ncbi:hypothetical protein O3M35_011395 [Rhynocoris fuscipes]|uniref:F-box domain-containing protein n=1 Tax=Rhynocoris fuscipes TaxID=488301 RepID=A0AAW1CXY6_9HEMI
MMNEMNISNLPVELKEYILTKLDGISLTRMRCVSKEWKNILDESNLLMFTKWKEVCERELGDLAIKSIMSNLEPKYFIHAKPDLWKISYKNWHQWYCIPEWNVKKSEIFKTSNCDITCIVNSGDWIIFSTRNYGSLNALNYVTKKPELCLYRGGNISNIRPYLISKDEPLLAGVAHDLLTFEFENLRRGELDLHTFHVNFAEELTGRNQIYYFENKEIKIEFTSEQSTITLSKKPGNEQRSIKVWDEWSIEYCWPDANLLLNEKGYYIVLDDEFNTLNSHPFCHSPVLHFKRRHLKVYFENCVIISVTTGHYYDHEMMVRARYKQAKYFPFLVASFHITSIICHGMMLIFGTDIGNIYVYRIRKMKDFLNLDLCSPTAVLEVDTEPIISITLKETIEKPILWAATSSTIYQINFL